MLSPIAAFYMKNNKHKDNYGGNTMDLIAKRGYIINKQKRLNPFNKAVFLDRDGTLHVDKVETRRIEDLEFFSDTIESLRRLRSAGFELVIVTNQSGIGKGHYKESEMQAFNDEMVKRLKDSGVEITALYYCPHKTEDKCQCKKPKDGMIRRAVMDLDLDIYKCYMIGDQNSDVVAGINAGINKNYLVKTGIYKSEDGKYHCPSDLIDKMVICNNLTEATNDILERDKNET